MEDITNFANQLLPYIPAALVFITAWMVFVIFRAIVFKQLVKYRDYPIAEFMMYQVRDIRWPIAVITGFYLASMFMPFVSDQVQRGLEILFVAAWIVQAVQLINGVVSAFISNMAQKSADVMDNIGTYKFLANGIKLTVWVIAIMLVLSNIGFDVSSLVAGLGVTGIAVALAVQTLLGDIINSFSIVTDKPFRVGDFIVVQDLNGTVEKIGIKSTRIRSLDGEEIIMSNSQLVNASIHNYGNINRRRSKHVLGITYETEPALIKDVPVIIGEILSKHDQVESDSYRIHMIEFGDFSINFEVVFYVKTPDYDRYLDIQQEVLFAIIDKFAAEEIEFAYPTQTIHIPKQ